MVCVDYKTYKLIFTVLHSIECNELVIDLVFHEGKKQ